MDPLIKKGGMPEIEMALFLEIIVKELISLVGGQRSQNDGKQGKQGPEAQSQTIRGGSHARGALLEGLKQLEMRRKVTKLADKACHASLFLIKIKNDYGFPASSSDGGTPYWFARATS
jgi:hypothetical protein